MLPCCVANWEWSGSSKCVYTSFSQQPCKWALRDYSLNIWCCFQQIFFNADSAAALAAVMRSSRLTLSFYSAFQPQLAITVQVFPHTNHHFEPQYFVTLCLPCSCGRLPFAELEIDEISTLNTLENMMVTCWQQEEKLLCFFYLAEWHKNAWARIKSENGDYTVH